MHPLFPRLASMYLVLPFVSLILMVGSLVDMITIDQSRVKHLPKFAWIIIVILIPLIGGILWFTIGREYVVRADRGSFGDPRRWAEPESASGAPSDSYRPEHRVRDAAAELAALEREIASHERAERIRKLEAELEHKRAEKDGSA